MIDLSNLNIELYMVVCGEYEGHYPLYAINGHQTVYDSERCPKLSLLKTGRTVMTDDFHIIPEYNNDINTIFNNTKVKLYTKEKAEEIVKEVKDCQFLNPNDKKNPQMIKISIGGLIKE